MIDQVVMSHDETRRVRSLLYLAVMVLIEVFVCLGYYKSVGLTNIAGCRFGLLQNRTVSERIEATKLDDYDDDDDEIDDDDDDDVGDDLNVTEPVC